MFISTLDIKHTKNQLCELSVLFNLTLSSALLRKHDDDDDDDNNNNSNSNSNINVELRVRNRLRGRPQELAMSKYSLIPVLPTIPIVKLLLEWYCVLNY